MEESIYFKPGDIVRLKQDVPNVPQMIVVKKETLLFKSKDEDKKNGLKGNLQGAIKLTGELREYIKRFCFW